MGRSRRKFQLLSRIAVLCVALCVAATASAVEPSFSNVQYATVGGQALRLDIYQPTTGSGPRPVLVHLHGGGWFSGDKYPIEPQVTPLLAQGIAIVSVQYRLTGNPWTFGDDLTFPAQIHDIKGAVRWLRANASTYNFDPKRIGVWGSSAGAHLAALLGTSGGVKALEGNIGGNLNYSSRVQAVGEYFGPTDLMNEGPDFNGLPGHDNTDGDFSTRARLFGWMAPGQGIGNIRANINNLAAPYPTLVNLVYQASPLFHVTNDDPPTFIAHGTVDQLVPVAQATKLSEALISAGVYVETNIVVGANHEEIPPSVDAALRSFLVAKLALDASGPSAPVLISAVGVSDSQIDLTWNPSNDAQSGLAEYIIYRANVEIARVAGSQTTFSDTGLTPNTSHSYKIAAVNGQFTDGPVSGTLAAQTMLDTSPPGVDDVLASGVPTIVKVMFDEPVNPATAVNLKNYIIQPGIAISGAALEPDQRTVTLTTVPLQPTKNYTLAVGNVQDAHGNGRGRGRGGPLVVPFTFQARVRSGLVAMYDFEEGSGDRVLDVSNVGAPLDLEIKNPGNVTWTDGGLRLDSATRVQSLFWGTKVIDGCKNSSEVTVEAWVTPANTTQDGPVRMITLSSYEHKRNVTLGPGQLEWVWLVRTTNTDMNGVPLIVSPWGDVTTNLTHIVATFDGAGMSKIYVNGVLRKNQSIGGNLSNWANGFRFALGNELFNDWPWLGTFHLVAVYNRALTAGDVTINFNAGPDPETVNTCPANIAGGDSVVDVFDLFELLSNWGTNGAGADLASPYEMVDVFDLFVILSAWGTCPGS